MIQINLLPDVKLEFIKAKRTKRLVMLIAAAAGGLTVSVMLILFLIVNVAQKQHLKNLSNDVAKYSQELKDIPDLDKILTIQNQLQSLPGLHDKKYVATRLFPYLTQLTPANASIANANVDFVNSKLSIGGSANNIGTINKFADTLKFTTYKGADGADKNAFSGVVLTSFANNADGATYQLDFTFDPAIFDSSQEISLTVPKIISTRSETEKPAALFQTNPSGQ